MRSRREAPPPLKPREIIKPGRVVVTLRAKKGEKKQPVVHTAPRAAVRFEKDAEGTALHVIALDESGRILRTIAVYKPSEWRKAKVHRPTFKPRPEIAQEYKRRQAIAAAFMMNEAFGQNWDPRKMPVH